jgi:hypothetical protein
MSEFDESNYRRRTWQKRRRLKVVNTARAKVLRGHPDCRRALSRAFVGLDCVDFGHVQLNEFTSVLILATDRLQVGVHGRRRSIQGKPNTL